MRFAVLCFAVLAAAGASPAPAQPGDAEKLFEARCAKCHALGKVAPTLAQRSPEARVKYLERFLQRHYAPEAEERKRIAAWLAAQAGAK
jgi:mono/diheme cytochrome c family protein